MSVLRRRVGAHELMDRPDVGEAELEAGLRDVARVNRWFGGRRALLRHVAALLPSGGGCILDVGTGSADLPREILRASRRRGATVRTVALDLHAATIAIAARESRGERDILPVRGDALRLPFAAGTFDLVLLSLTLHHFDGPRQIELLRELHRVSRGRLLVGELERSVLNYAGARLMAATLWRGHPITRHDGPLSVLRAFTASELQALGREAGLRGLSVHRHPFGRLILKADPGRNP